MALVAATLLAALLVWDLRRSPADQLSAGALVMGIELYRRRLAPLATALGARCRFEPSCSRYSEVVIRRFGSLNGSWLTARRLARCGPWTPRGTVDPPPSATD